MIAYFNSSMRQKLLSTNYGMGERTLGALAPSLPGKKAARLVCQSFGRIEKVGVECKGARD